jgi:hypothetical protein
MELNVPAAGCDDAMAMEPKKPDGRRLQPTLSTGSGARMTRQQKALLRQLALDGYEPEAFSEQLTQSEAARRIAMLQAKLKLMDEPPHVL